MKRLLVLVLFAVLFRALAAPCLAAPFLSVLSSPAIVGQPIMIGYTGFGASTFTLSFGDGSSAVVTTGTGTGTVPHVYASVGTYSIQASVPNAGVIATATVQVVPAPTLYTLYPTAPSIAGRPTMLAVRIFGNVPAGGILSLNFGDGSSMTIPGAGIYAHTYGLPGLVIASLTLNRVTVARAGVDVAAPTARVPMGTILSSSLIASPVLAGGQTSILLNYLLDAGRFHTASDPIYAIVALRNGRNQRLSYSDPIQINAGYGNVGINEVSIPYEVPAAAAGQYFLQVYLRVASGGTVATGQLIPLTVVGGPDPKPSVVSTIHGNGALEIGSHAAGSPATINPDLALQVRYPTYAATLQGMFDPVARRPDAALTFAPLQSSTLQPPSSTGLPTFALKGGHNYAYVFGHATAQLPQMLGGGETVRGIDLTDAVGSWFLHAGTGFTQIVNTSSDIPSQATAYVDIAHTLSRNGASLRATILDRNDGIDTDDFLVSGPQIGSAALLTFSDPLAKNLALDVEGALSSTRANVVGATAISDAASRIQLNYTGAKTQFSLQYHDAGPQFTVGNGPGALSDRAGTLDTMTLVLPKNATLSLGYSLDAARSAFSVQSNAFANLSLLLDQKTTATFGVSRTAARTSLAVPTTNQMLFSLNRMAGQWMLGASGTLASNSDSLNSLYASTTRTASLQASRQAGASSLAFGLNATSVRGLGSTAQVGESVEYGFPLFGRTLNGQLVRGLQDQIALNNSIVNNYFGPNRTVLLEDILSYHLNSHLALGLRADLQHVSGFVPYGGTGTVGSIRLRLDFTQ